MSYKDLSKIIPDDKSNTNFLDKIIEDSSDSESSSSSSDESDKKIPPPPARKEKKQKQKKEDNTEDKKILIRQLKGWQGSFNFLEEKKIEITKQLKDKVSKALGQGFDVKLSVLEALIDELKFVAGVDITAPPIQADIILHGVNPLIENIAINYGYNIAGFSNTAAITCKMPLLMFLIENDIMFGKKPSPLIMLALACTQTLVAVYSQNKLQSQQPEVKVEEAKQALPPLDPPPVETPAEQKKPEEGQEVTDF